MNQTDLHVDPECPDVQGEDGSSQPAGELQPVQTTPGPREEASWEGAVQLHLQETAGN